MSYFWLLVLPPLALVIFEIGRIVRDEMRKWLETF
jgi:hypothetical protein